MSPKQKLRTPSHSWSFSAIGTEWWIGIEVPSGELDVQQLEQSVARRIESFDLVYSRFRPDSTVTRMAASAGSYRLPGDSEALLILYRQLYDATNGAVTPLIGDVLVAAGYDAEYSLTPTELPRVPQWDDVISYAENTMTLKQPATLDFGAAGKGYVVDIISSLLEGRGIRSYIVDAGGDMVVRGSEPKRIGLEHPTDADQVIGVATLTNQAIAGSAGNRRKWSTFHHIIDPFTGTSPTRVRAAWVVAGSAALADGLATALSFVEPEVLTQFDFEYLLINDRYQYKYSPEFPAEIF